MGVKAKGGRARVGGFGLLSPVRSFPSNAVLQGFSGLTNASAWRCSQNNAFTSKKCANYGESEPQPFIYYSYPIQIYGTAAAHSPDHPDVIYMIPR